MKSNNYKCKSWNNRQFVAFLSKVEFPNNYEVKIYDSKNNESKSYIKKITPLTNIPVKTEEKKNVVTPKKRKKLDI